MIKTATKDARPGQTLAQSVLNKNGMVILGAGTKLTEHYLLRLRRLGVDDIYIRPDQPSDPPTPTVHSAETTIPRPPIRPSSIGIDGSRAAVREMFADFMESRTIGARLSASTLGYSFPRLYRKLLERISGHPFVLEQLTQLHRKDPFLLRHAMNVSALSAIVGFASDYSEEQLYDLTVSALLFDIGMLNVPDSLFMKTGPLTKAEKTRIEYHTIEGHRLLSGREDLPSAAAWCALQHHERYDGSGYPFRVKRSEIHDYAQIIGIADLYDALVSARYHRDPFAPGDAIEFLLGSGNHLFNLSFVKLFVRHISIYPVGSRVKLNNGQTAIISSVNPSFVQRPVVKIIQEPDGSMVRFPYEVDLQSHLEVVIADIIQ